MVELNRLEIFSRRVEKEEKDKRSIISLMILSMMMNIIISLIISLIILIIIISLMIVTTVVTKTLRGGVDPDINVKMPSRTKGGIIETVIKVTNQYDNF